MLFLPYTSALEHMRKKIEISTEKIRVAKVKEEEARKVCCLLCTDLAYGLISNA